MKEVTCLQRLGSYAKVALLNQQPENYTVRVEEGELPILLHLFPFQVI